MKPIELEEICERRQQWSQTHRPSVPAMETLIYRPMEVLNEGFVRVIDYMGDDEAIVQAARVSYGRGTVKPSEDRTLIRYLIRHRHSTPFEMCELKLHVKLPIFVARQWVRHRTANINEYSARYSILDKEFYIPEVEHMAAQSKSNRQGRGDLLSPTQAIHVQRLLTADAEQAYDHYLSLLAEDDETRTGDLGEPTSAAAMLRKDEDFPGLARELARMGLSLNFYTQWYWKIDLHNLFGFLSLRADAHAQYEIRVYADQILKICEAWVPMATEAFLDYRLNAFTLSSPMVAALKNLCQATGLIRPSLGSLLEGQSLSKREREELLTLLSKP